MSKKLYTTCLFCGQKLKPHELLDHNCWSGKINEEDLGID